MQFRLIVAVLVPVLVPAFAPAQQRPSGRAVAYEIAFPNAAHHEARVDRRPAGLVDDHVVADNIDRTEARQNGPGNRFHLITTWVFGSTVPFTGKMVLGPAGMCCISLS